MSRSSSPPSPRSSLLTRCGRRRSRPRRHRLARRRAPRPPSTPAPTRRRRRCTSTVSRRSPPRVAFGSTRNRPARRSRAPPRPSPTAPPCSSTRSASPARARHGGPSTRPMRSATDGCRPPTREAPPTLRRSSPSAPRSTRSTPRRSRRIGTMTALVCYGDDDLRPAWPGHLHRRPRSTRRIAGRELAADQRRLRSRRRAVARTAASPRRCSSRTRARRTRRRVGTEVVGHFDDPESRLCFTIPFGVSVSSPVNAPEPVAIVACRASFVVTSLTPMP